MERSREIPFEKRDAKVSLNSKETDLAMSILCQVIINFIASG